jgi:hypothetical protein
MFSRRKLQEFGKKRKRKEAILKPCCRLALLKSHLKTEKQTDRRKEKNLSNGMER